MNTLLKQKKFILPTGMNMFFNVAAYLYFPFLAPYFIGQGFSKEEISIVFALAPLALIITSAVIGKLSDDVGRKNILTFSLFFECIAILLYLIVGGNILILILARILSTIGVTSYSFTILQKTEDNIKTNRGILTSIYSSLSSGGTLIGTALGTLVVIYLPMDFLFKISLIFYLIIFVFVYFLQDQKRGKFEKRGLNFFQDIKEFWNTMGLKGMGMLGAAMHASQPGRIIFIPLLIIQSLNGDIKDVGIFATIWSLMHLLQFLCGKWCDKYGGGKVTLASTLLFGFLFTLFAFVTNVSMIFVLAAIISLVGGFWNTSAWCYMSRIGEKQKKEGLVTGSYISIAKTGNAISYFVSGILVSFLGIRPLFLIYGGIIILTNLVARKYFVETDLSG